ncbi:DUF5518 domain-containing protein [Natronorubrum sp. DTA28]|uniref:DUF5518 domain-containing protein n=1 Tax=Natronorubrum sp. DTA28 TaxID=3447019 RepID=UPI003F860DDC
MVNSRTLINALIGAIVGVVLSFIPLSTVLGGAAAAFLEGPDTRDGAIVGALAGAITFLPLAGIAIFGLGVLGFGMGIAAVPFEGFALVALVVLAAVALLFFYTVGLSALGGYLGAYLAQEYPVHRVRTRETIGLSSDRSGSEAVARTRSSGPQSDSRQGRDREPNRPDARDSRRDRDVERGRR